MTTRYRVEYALKTHRRDQLIEWIKGLLAVPFVLHSQPTAIYSDKDDILPTMASTSHRRYAEVLQDVEDLVNDHSNDPVDLLYSAATFSTIPALRDPVSDALFHTKLMFK